MLLVAVVVSLSGCGESSSFPAIIVNSLDDIIVNSLDDISQPEEGIITLRSALNVAVSSQKIKFDPSLDGEVINLTIVGNEDSILKGEVMGMRTEESGEVSYLLGYFNRNYGASALYARKNVVIDASSLPSGITIAWTGGVDARILAVYGSLTMNNIKMTGGRSVFKEYEALNAEDPYNQPYTLGRGGALAVWGKATLNNCVLYGNYCEGDSKESRDRGAFGGGLYADIVYLNNCIISGNSITGGGAAGGGVYSAGGADSIESVSNVFNSSITDNSITALFTYGAGIYSDGGGIGNQKTLSITNCTIARNVVKPLPKTYFPPFLWGYYGMFLDMGYWRGGAAYASNGFLSIKSSTIVENEVYGKPRTDSRGRKNLAGAVVATVGNAHAVEEMTIGHSIIVGNKVFEIDDTGATTNEYDHDIFTGSMLHFQSLGYNRLGVIDFSQMLVPVGEKGWESLCRKHFPKEGDLCNVVLEDSVNMISGPVTIPYIISTGSNSGNPAVHYYNPGSSSQNQLPATPYLVDGFFAEYTINRDGTDNFLHIVLDKVENHYDSDLPENFATDFETDFETFLQSVDSDPTTSLVAEPYKNPSGEDILTLEDTLFFGPAVSWPKKLENYPYMEFWYQLNSALKDEVPTLGPEKLGDEVWDSMFDNGIIPDTDITIKAWTSSIAVSAEEGDQLGNDKTEEDYCDIGSIELQ